MAEHERTSQKNQEKADQKHNIRQQDSQPLSEQFHAWDQELLSLTETPFCPRIDEHTAILSRIPFSAQRHEFVMRLHQTYGNSYVQRLVESVRAQAKLTVNAPNDIYEQEADRVAGTVTRSMNSQVQRQVEPEEEEEEVMPKLAAGLQRQAKEEGEEEPVQTKDIFETQRQELPEEELQAQLTKDEPLSVSDNLETRINNARGSGHPLSDNVREPMERAFGADSSKVRVHTDSEADALNQQLSSKAFTTRQDIFFREGEYSPSSDSGRKLIAHELTHVVQQSAAIATQQVATTSKPATKEDAIAKVKKYIVPGECFVQYHSTRRGWQPIPGTGCAHWVAHEKNITTGYKCDRGFSVRTGKLGTAGVITGKDKYSLQKAKVGDIWASTKLISHVGIVRDVKKDKGSGKVIEVLVEHDYSKQGGVSKNWFKEGEFYR